MQLLGELNASAGNIVLSRNEWKNIKNRSEHVTKKSVEEQRFQDERKEKSNLISENWPNKIVDLRKKRLEARKLREEDIEQEKEKLDLEEAEYQSHKRKEIIENAKKQLYSQDERIRRLQGALLLSRVMKEREHQIELNKKKAVLFEDVEAKYLEFIKKQDEDERRERHDRGEKNRREKRDLAAELNKQMTSKEKFENETREDILKLRQELKEQDEQYIEELLRNVSDKQQQQKRLLQEQQWHHSEQKKIHGINEQKYYEESIKADLYAEAKIKLKRMKDERERREFAEKQERLEQLRGNFTEQFTKKLQDEEETYKRTAQEKEEKAMEDDEKKRIARKQALADCLSHYKIQMAEHQSQSKAVQMAAAEEMKKIKLDYQLLHNEVREKHQRQLEKQKRQSQILAQQINERREKASNERAKELADDLKLYDQLLAEEEFFQNYAQKVFENVKEKGYNILPILRAAEPGIGFGRGPVYKDRANIRPTYQASDVSGAPLQHILPQIRSFSPTAQRLGF